MQWLDRYFGLTASGSTWWRELRAGLTTFLTMAYILFVNPDLLSGAITVKGAFPQLLTATALAAAIGSLLMGIVARYPFALAPGMGLNAYFVQVVKKQGIAWQAALGAVLISGVLFVILSVTGIRDAVLRAIPRDLRAATAAGIGLFLATIGAQNAGWIQADPFTMVTLGDLGASGSLLALVGLVVTGALQAVRFRGAILVGIAVTSVLAMVTGAGVYADGASFAGFPDGIVQVPVWPGDLFFALDLRGALDLGVVAVVFTFAFVDLFDTAGTLVGLADKAGFTDASGELPRASAAFASDALATCAGAVVGTSTTTSYIESAAGIEAGGRTGITAIVVGVLFVLATAFWPLAATVPGVATAPVLVLVGASMMTGLGRIGWDDPRRGIPAFLTIVGMPLTFSIANGIAFGLMAWVVLHVLSGRWRDVHWVLFVLAALMVLRYAWLAAG